MLTTSPNTDPRYPQPLQLNFQTSDNTTIHFRYWPPVSPTPTNQPQKALILFHRGHEHGGRMDHIPHELFGPLSQFGSVPGNCQGKPLLVVPPATAGVNRLQWGTTTPGGGYFRGTTTRHKPSDKPTQHSLHPDFHIFAWDARGLGLSTGTATSFQQLTQDANEFFQHIQKTFNITPENTAVIAQSVGSIIAAAWILDYGIPIRAVCLAAPAFEIKLYVPFAIPALRLLSKSNPTAQVTSYVKPRFLTHDTLRQNSYSNDPLIKQPISVQLLLEMHQASQRLIQNAHSFHPPTLILSSKSDFIVYQKPQIKFFNNLPNPSKSFVNLPNFYHDTLGEINRHIPLSHIRSFLSQTFSQPYSPPNLTFQEHHSKNALTSKQLATPLPKLSPANLYWAAYRAQLSLGAHLSQGLLIGKSSGFDSGQTLDYVYNNTPTGHTPIGKLIDAHYLNAIGWQGIRARKQHIQQALTLTSTTLANNNQPIHILDIAAGYSRYVFDHLHSIQNHNSNNSISPESVLLRDFSLQNTSHSQQYIHSHLRHFPFASNFHAQTASAFDVPSLLQIPLSHPNPSVIIVSGLYELFPDNALLTQSLQALHDILAPNGFLIYTNQPWHPQLTMIARALTSHKDGKARVMRCRPQIEIDTLVQNTGLTKINQLTGPQSIFTVSIAQKIAPRTPAPTTP